MRRFIVLLLLQIPLILCGIFDWKTISTNHFTIYHQQGWELEAWKVLETMETHRPFVEELTGNSRQGQAVIIQDMGNLVNGYVNPVRDIITLYAHFPSGGDLDYIEDWWTTVGVHEYIHMLQITQEGGTPMILRKTLGNLLYTNQLHPMWMIEGITVYGESELSPYSGRLNGGSYQAGIATLAKLDKLPSATKASYLSHDHPHVHYYGMGGAFFRFLAEQYGEDKFAAVYRINGSRLGAYATPFLPEVGIDQSVKQVYGKRLPQLWDEWRQAEKDEADGFVLPARYVTQTGWFKNHLRQFDGLLYYTSFEPVKADVNSTFGAHVLYEYDPATDIHKPLLRQARDFPASFQITPEHIFYTRTEYRRGFANTDDGGWGGETQLRRRDRKSSDDTLIWQGAIRAFTVLTDANIILALDRPHHQGSIVRIITPQGSVRDEFATDHLITTIYTHKSRIYVSARSYWRNSSIYHLDPVNHSLFPVLDSPFAEHLTGFYDDLFVYTANYEGYLHSYMLDAVSGTVYRIAGASYMTSAQVDRTDEHVHFITMSDKGYELGAERFGLVEYDFPEYKEPQPPFPERRDIPTDGQVAGIKVRNGGYWNNLAHLLYPRMFRLPLVMVQGDSVAVGVVLVGSDAVGDIPYWQMELLYDFHQQEPRLRFTVDNNLLLPLQHTITYSSFDDHSVISNQYVELLRRNNWGIDHIRAGFAFTARDELQRRTLSPYLDLSYSNYGFDLSNRLLMNWEDADILGSDRRRRGFISLHRMRMLIPWDSQLSAFAQFVHDPDAGDDEVFFPIRGYNDPLAANQGALMQFTISRIIAQVRQGLWNPQIYLEDIGLGVFTDLALPRSGQGVNMQYAFGLELKAETSVGFFMPLQTTFRIAYNREGKVQPSFSLSSIF